MVSCVLYLSVDQSENTATNNRASSFFVCDQFSFLVSSTNRRTLGPSAELLLLKISVLDKTSSYDCVWITRNTSEPL